MLQLGHRGPEECSGYPKKERWVLGNRCRSDWISILDAPCAYVTTCWKLFVSVWMNLKNQETIIWPLHKNNSSLKLCIPDNVWHLKPFLNTLIWSLTITYYSTLTTADSGWMGRIRSKINTKPTQAKHLVTLLLSLLPLRRRGLFNCWWARLGLQGIVRWLRNLPRLVLLWLFIFTAFSRPTFVIHLSISSCNPKLSFIPIPTQTSLIIPI